MGVHRTSKRRGSKPMKKTKQSPDGSAGGDSLPLIVSHSGLVDLAATWLRKSCSVIMTELSTIGEEPDVIGWQGNRSTLIECKVSRSDFLADRRKNFRLCPESGIGRQRYFIAPKGLISPEELPDGWGLLEADGRRVRQKKRSEYFKEINERHEITLLLSALRRIGHDAPEGVSIRCYNYETKSRATLGVANRQFEEPADD